MSEYTMKTSSVILSELTTLDSGFCGNYNQEMIQSQMDGLFDIVPLTEYLSVWQEVCLAYEEKHLLTIQFDPAYKDDLHIRTIDEVLHVTYKEHPHVVSFC